MHYSSKCCLCSDLAISTKEKCSNLLEQGGWTRWPPQIPSNLKHYMPPLEYIFVVHKRLMSKVYSVLVRIPKTVVQARLQFIVELKKKKSPVFEMLSSSSQDSNNLGFFSL